ncbi:MAG: hypothetical protein HY062_18505 [Bacteroidetes bacterium]|nr:hypothetical protein [Bacteroidota bacterium]
MRQRILYITLLVLGVTIIGSCKKTPGEGGNARIKGTFWVRNYDQLFTYVTGRYPAINTTVYLFFGDDVSPGTSVKTNENGEFEFQYLRKGKYRVVAYSKQRQSTNTTPDVTAVEYDVTITKRKEIKNIGLDTLNN